MEFEIKIKNNLPFISILKDLEESDLGPVTESENSIRCIFGDDPWITINDYFELNLRLRVAEEIDRELRTLVNEKKIIMDQAHYMDLAKMIKVYKCIAIYEIVKEDVSTKLYKSTLKEILDAITDFNLNSLMRGASK